MITYLHIIYVIDSLTNSLLVCADFQHSQDWAQVHQQSHNGSDYTKSYSYIILVATVPVHHCVWSAFVLIL
jgi:hypothetical protein